MKQRATNVEITQKTVINIKMMNVQHVEQVCSAPMRREEKTEACTYFIRLQGFQFSIVKLGPRDKNS